MKLVKQAKQAENKFDLTLTQEEWEKLGKENGWITIEAKRAKKKKKKSPMQHGFIDQCIKENKDKKSPGGYCASVVDKAKGTTEWRKEK